MKRLWGAGVGGVLRGVAGGRSAEVENEEAEEAVVLLGGRWRVG